MRASFVVGTSVTFLTFTAFAAAILLGACAADDPTPPDPLEEAASGGGDGATSADGGGRDASPDTAASSDGPAGAGDPDATANVNADSDTGNGDAAADAAADAAPVCIESDAGCSTGNLGACAAGVIHCDGDGGAPVCSPRATTQACYDGPAGTRNIGACHDGTQGCVGALGACSGQAMPAAKENCFNTVDDDCNGAINNGCPASLALGPDRHTGAVGGNGGAAVSMHCPVGAFVTRVDSWFDNADKHVSGVSISCATPSLVQGASMYSITLVPNQPAPYATLTGSTGPTNDRHDDCGITGLTAVTSTVGLADTFVEGLGSHCGTSAVTLNADNTLTFAFATNGDQTYNTWTGNPGAFFTRACNPNEVVVGFALRTGLWLDSIEPVCAALVVSYK